MKIRTSLKKHKNIIIFFSVLFILGIICGIILFLIQPDLTKSAISIELDKFKDYILYEHQNQILFHTGIILIIFLLNFTIIGFFGNVFYLFYEACSIGFSMAVFTYKFGPSGLLFASIFNLLSKTLFIAALVYICLVGTRIVKKIVGCIVLKENTITYPFLKRMFIILGILLGIVLVSETMNYFLTNKILELFLFLL